MGTGIAVITLLGQIVATFGPLAVDEIEKIKANMQLGPDVQVNVHDLASKADAANADTIAQVNAWRASLNPPLPPL